MSNITSKQVDQIRNLVSNSGIKINYDKLKINSVIYSIDNVHPDFLDFDSAQCQAIQACFDLIMIPRIPLIDPDQTIYDALTLNQDTLLINFYKIIDQINHNKSISEKKQLVINWLFK